MPARSLVAKSAALDLPSSQRREALARVAKRGKTGRATTWKRFKVALEAEIAINLAGSRIQAVEFKSQAIKTRMPTL